MPLSTNSQRVKVKTALSSSICTANFSFHHDECAVSSHRHFQTTNFNSSKLSVATTKRLHLQHLSKSTLGSTSYRQLHHHDTSQIRQSFHDVPGYRLHRSSRYTWFDFCSKNPQVNNVAPTDFFEVTPSAAQMNTHTHIPSTVDALEICCSKDGNVKDEMPLV